MTRLAQDSCAAIFFPLLSEASCLLLPTPNSCSSPGHRHNGIFSFRGRIVHTHELLGFPTHQGQSLGKWLFLPMPQSAHLCARQQSIPSPPILVRFLMLRMVGEARGRARARVSPSSANSFPWADIALKIEANSFQLCPATPVALMPHLSFLPSPLWNSLATLPRIWKPEMSLTHWTGQKVPLLCHWF